VIQGLEGHPGSQCAIANDGHRTAILLALRSGYCMPSAALIEVLE